MGNYISYSRNDIIFSGILIALWIVIRPFFVRMGEKAQAQAASRLEAEAAQNDSSSARVSSPGAAGGSRRKKVGLSHDPSLYSSLGSAMVQGLGLKNKVSTVI